MDAFSKAVIETEVRLDECEIHGSFESTGVKLGSRIMHWSTCCECSALKQAEADVDAIRKIAEEKQRRLDARMDQAGIPLRYRSKDFASFITDTDKKEKALVVAMEFAQNFEAHKKKGTMMVFSGLPGTGKSHLAIAAAQNVMRTGTAFYLSAIDAVRMIRSTWRSESAKTETQVLHMLSTIDLLVLDEVGVQYGSDAEQLTMFDIIDKRYRDLRPTILITNQNRAGVKSSLGDRSFDRLREGGIWVTFDWQSQRSSLMA